MKYFCNVIITNTHKNIITPVGETLDTILKMAGIPFRTPCGGNHTCGKCKIHITGGISVLTEDERHFLSDTEIGAGYRLACFTRILGDCQITIPAQESISVFENSSNLTNNITLDQHFGKGALGIAIDLGTTTVSARFFDLTDGTALGTISRQNAAGRFGDDFISRISASTEGMGKQIQIAILDQLNDMIYAFSKDHYIDADAIALITIVGNTPMLHLLMNYDVTALAVFPFTAASLFGSMIDRSDLSLTAAPCASLYLGACLNSFVGSDCTAGILASGMADADTTRLLIDVGTNGEIALGKKGAIWCCSVAAGPAFEGARISKGVGGIPGAISSVNIENGQISLTTIGDIPPIGICGSGLLDAIAHMLHNDIIDMTGKIRKPHQLPPGLEQAVQNDAFYLDVQHNIAITQRDIREVQLAKSAFAAGISILLDHAKCSCSDITHVHLAGGFGSLLSPSSACAIGMIPPDLSSRISGLGNIALTGASMALLSHAAREKMSFIAQDIHSVDLIESSNFMDQFSENMLFP